MDCAVRLGRGDRHVRQAGLSGRRECGRSRRGRAGVGLRRVHSEILAAAGPFGGSAVRAGTGGRGCGRPRSRRDDRGGRTPGRARGRGPGTRRSRAVRGQRPTAAGGVRGRGAARVCGCAARRRGVDVLPPLRPGRHRPAVRLRRPARTGRVDQSRRRDHSRPRPRLRRGRRLGVSVHGPARRLPHVGGVRRPASGYHRQRRGLRRGCRQPGHAVAGAAAVVVAPQRHRPPSAVFNGAPGAGRAPRPRGTRRCGRRDDRRGPGPPHRRRPGVDGGRRHGRDRSRGSANLAACRRRLETPANAADA